MPPADVRDVNATWLGRIVHSSAAPNTNMIVTAFRGCREESTRPIQLDRGSTPSRATAKTRREAATTATLVFCVWHVSDKGGKVQRATCQDEANCSDDGHEDTAAFSESQCVQLDKWLRRLQGKKRIQVRCAEEEEDCGRKAETTGRDSAPQNTARSHHALEGGRLASDIRQAQNATVPGILGLLCYMSRGVEAYHGSGSEQASQCESICKS